MPAQDARQVSFGMGRRAARGMRVAGTRILNRSVAYQRLAWHFEPSEPREAIRRQALDMEAAERLSSKCFDFGYIEK